MSCLLKAFTSSLDVYYSPDFLLQVIFDYAKVKALNGPILEHFVMFFRKKINIFRIVVVGAMTYIL